jgi:hypothetical protein
MTAIGAGAGYAHGVYKSFKNQGKEIDKKYQEKAAAVNMLMDEGLDFETAAELVMEKVAYLGTVAGAVTGSLSANKNDRVGGAISGALGGSLGSAVGQLIGGKIGHLAGGIAGGQIAGRAYSKQKGSKSGD